MILIYSYEFPTAIGGIASFIFNLADYLSSKKPNLVVLTRGFSGEDKLLDQKQLFVTIRLPGYKNTLVNYLIGIFSLPLVIIMFKPKIILVADILSQRIVSFLSLLRLVNKGRIFLSCYGSEIITNYNENGIKKILFTRIYHNAPLIIAISRYTKELLLQKQIPENKIIIINPWLDNKWVSNNSNSLKVREELKLKNANIILTVARLSYRKGQDIVISLMPKILKELPSTKYLIVGEGEDRMKLKEIVYKNNLQDDVIFIGKVKKEDLIDYYDACDIFVMPSREVGNLTEGFGISFIEAGARGKPVIGTRVGGIADAVVNGQTGYLVEENDLNGLYEKIICLLSDKKLAYQLGENARRHVRDNFLWDNINNFVLNKIFQ